MKLHSYNTKLHLWQLRNGKPGYYKCQSDGSVWQVSSSGKLITQVAPSEDYALQRSKYLKWFADRAKEICSLADKPSRKHWYDHSSGFEYKSIEDQRKKAAYLFGHGWKRSGIWFIRPRLKKRRLRLDEAVLRQNIADFKSLRHSRLRIAIQDTMKQRKLKRPSLVRALEKSVIDAMTK